MDWRERFAAYVQEQLPAATAVRVERVSALPAGASNQTVAVDLEVTCEGAAHLLPLVLRPEREDGILAPYDVERQYRILRALARTDVPVPATAWFEASREVLGTRFFAMARVEAQTPQLFWMTRGSPRLDSAAATLATIHAVDWRTAGLGFLAPEGPLPSPLECELPQWRARAEHNGLGRSDVMRRLEEYLLAHEPDDARHALIHGDTNAGNYLVRENRVVAVVDWELSAIGDPRSDLGFYAALHAIFGGFPLEPGETELSEAYERVTGRTLEHLDFYEAWGLYRMLVVTGGWGRAGLTGWGYYAIDERLRQLLGPGWAGLRVG